MNFILFNMTICQEKTQSSSTSLCQQETRFAAIILWQNKQDSIKFIKETNRPLEFGFDLLHK